MCKEMTYFVEEEQQSGSSWLRGYGCLCLRAIQRGCAVSLEMRMVNEILDSDGVEPRHARRIQHWQYNSRGHSDILLAS